MKSIYIDRPTLDKNVKSLTSDIIIFEMLG